MYVLNGGEAELEAIRKVIHMRWPSPVIKDMRPATFAGPQDQEDNDRIWLFKVVSIFFISPSKAGFYLTDFR